MCAVKCAFVFYRIAFNVTNYALRHFDGLCLLLLDFYVFLSQPHHKVSSEAWISCASSCALHVFACIVLGYAFMLS